MWTCPRCNRQFKTKNQSHSCVTKTIGDFFADKPDNLVLAFDQILTQVIDWEPNSVGTSQNAIIFTSKKAWLIIRPMKKELDVKFYYSTPIESGLVKKVTVFNGKYAHHFRIQDEQEVTSDLVELLKMGYDFSLE